jgi:cyclophilin family peptidyl-prolyl cis-trans isomerase
MSNRKTRDRQLAKLAARRHAQRRRQRRQRIVAGVVAVALAAGGGTGLYLAFTGGGDNAKNRAHNTPSPRVKVKHGSGKQTGTVKPKPAPAAVACGATAPPAAGKPKPQFKGPPPLAIDKKATYFATMKTSCGAIRIQLLPKQAPETVNSFVFLAKHHYFNGQYFHRIDTSIDVLQGGDPTGTGSGGPGYQIPDELTGHDTYAPGTLAMANAGANTGGSQFFLIVGAKGHNLDAQPNYTVFGKVVKGLNVGQRIEKIPVVDPSSISTQTPKQAIYIDAVVIHETGGRG